MFLGDDQAQSGMLAIVTNREHKNVATGWESRNQPRGTLSLSSYPIHWPLELANGLLSIVIQGEN